jgi:transposase InsO family protein
MSRWKRQFAEEGENAFPGHGRVTPDQERIHHLERENEILCQERDILKKQWPSSRAQWVYHHLYHTHDEAKADVFFYIESFYNRPRRHSALDYLGPEAYGQLFHERERTFA